MWHDHTALRRAEGVKVERVGSGAASAKETVLPFLSTATVPERTLMPSDLSGLSVVAFEVRGAARSGEERNEVSTGAREARLTCNTDT